MKDRFFVDTNILVYANDRSIAAKQEQARNIILEGISRGNGVISTQVLGEFYVTVTRKIKIKLPEDIAKREILLLRAFEVVEIDFPLVIEAINISNTHALSYWDSLIIASAQKAKCTLMYSEDMQSEQAIDNLTIKNPFV